MKLDSTEHKLHEKILEGKRLNADETVVLLNSKDILSLGRIAGLIRNKKATDSSVVTYIVDRNINYTNICTSECSFCAFYKDKDNEEAFLLSYTAIAEKIKETIEAGGMQILLQGGLHPDLFIEYYEDLLRNIKKDFNIDIHAFSPPEIINISKISSIPVDSVLSRLKKAGLDSVPGGGAEILDDKIRVSISPGKCSTDEWFYVMERAHNIDLPTTATMMFGHVESTVEIAKHLIRIRDLQDKTKGFTAFIPWSFQPGNTDLGGVAATGFDYLRVLAVSRIVLDNIPNIQASWVTQGPKVAQVSLQFGANDMGSTMLEENVVKAAGVSFMLTEKEIRQLIESAGYVAQKRNMRYRHVDRLLRN